MFRAKSRERIAEVHFVAIVGGFIIGCKSR
jgi:hypothetical protein